MNIYDLPFHYKQNSNKNNLNNRYNPNFSGNIKKTVQTFQLCTAELSQVSALSKYSRQLNALYRAAGDYVGDVLKKSVKYIVPAGATAITLNGVLNSKDVEDVKLEQNNTASDSSELLSLTLGRGQNADVARISVSKSGQADVIADEDMSQSDLSRYLSEINKNHDKLFSAVLDKTETSVNTINELLDTQTDYNFDLTSKTDIQKVVEEFVDKKKRVTILTKFIDRHSLERKFNGLNEIQFSVKDFVLNNDVTFSYSGISNSTYDGIGLIVTNKKTGEKQGFVAMNDGNIYKTKTFMADDYMNSKIWRMHNLKVLSHEELENPDLKYMFNHVCMHNDRMCKAMLGSFYRKGNPNIEAFDLADEKTKARSVKTEEKPFSEDTAKTIKVYKLNPELMTKVQEMEKYLRRIAEVYGNSDQGKCRVLTENSGFIRRKYSNTIILKDITLDDGKMLLGTYKYTYGDGIKSDELLSFCLYDENIEEIARFKVMDNGDTKLLVKPGATAEYAQNIENAVKSGLENGLAEKIIAKLSDACYYHENFTKVNNYVKKSYSQITVADAVKELRSSKEFYRFDEGKVRQLRKNLDSLADIYKRCVSTSYRWQDAFFKPLNVQSKRYMCGELEKFGVVYEASVSDKSNFSGIRILTKDTEGNWLNCYAISNDGNTYKLIKLPPAPELRYVSCYIDDGNLSQLDAEAVKAEHLDLIFQDLFNTVSVFNDFMLEGSARRESRQGIYPYRVLMARVDEYKEKLDKLNGKEVDLSAKIPASETADVVRRKPGRPKKDPSEVTQKQNTETDVVKRKPGRPKKDPSVVKLKPVKPVNPTKTGTTVSVPVTRTVTGTYSVKPFMSLSMEDAISKIDKILATPYEKRSPHLVHDLKSTGDVFVNRFSVTAPDGAWVTVSVMQYGMSSHYYSIRVQKDNEVMYLNLNPETGYICRCDIDNTVILGAEGRPQTISKEKFAEKNPLSANMSMYFDELFATKPEVQRKTIPWQIFKKQDTAAKQAMREAERALRMTKVPKKIMKEMQAEFKEFDEPEEE